MQNQKLCLKWNNHMSNMLSLLGSFQQKDTLVDVTISCQGQNIKAHKIILSACSPYFQNIFMENPCQHPIIIINGMKFDDITAILNFMYKGEVNVSHDGLSSFLQAAEALKVKGLAEVCGEKKGTNSISQEVQQSELNRPQRTDTPPRKRPRNRKRSLSDSNRSDDEGLSRKHREPSSPEVHELSGDESFTGDNSSNGPPFNSISRVPQNVYSRSHQSSSNMGGEDDDEYDVVESNKMLDTTDSNVSMNNTNTDNNLRIERIMGNATEIESSSMADPESPPDIKPIINFGESSAGPSESGNLMLYNEQSQPGPSNVQDSSLLHDNSHAQDLKKREVRENKQPSSLDAEMNAIKTTEKCSVLSLYLWVVRRMVNWAPPPLKGVDMNAHKQWLKKMVNQDTKEDEEECAKRMELCFPLRRKEINMDATLHYLKKEYPFMFTYENILKEYQMLMLINAEKVFITNAFRIAPNLIKLVRGRKNSGEIVNILNSIPSELKKVDQVIACLIILPYLFTASSSLVYIIYDENTPVRVGLDSLEEGPNYPHVAVIGNPFSSDSEAYVVAQGEILIECSDFIEAIIACMATYYCCNIAYPEGAIDTYHFIQTQFLKLEHHGELSQKVTILAEEIKKGVF